MLNMKKRDRRGGEDGGRGANDVRTHTRAQVEKLAEVIERETKEAFNQLRRLAPFARGTRVTVRLGPRTESWCEKDELEARNQGIDSHMLREKSALKVERHQWWNMTSCRMESSQCLRGEQSQSCRRW